MNTNDETEDTLRRKYSIAISFEILLNMRKTGPFISTMVIIQQLQLELSL